ncbi:glutamate receptor ionotropic, kainate 1 [Rhipicephalus sanguineus]|uniref:glutamate receptor ionotropic, kainate 1 n=1 Tax=Rhipicephalus sanguineus TaxID=34632 RepID=UPI001895C2A2|nr:glutamate receptor ionotropic, kainate 1 [Rhipicephalus sanguineus]
MDASTWCTTRGGLLTWLLLTLVWTCGAASGGNDTTVLVTETGTTVAAPKFGAGLTTFDDTFLYLQDENSQDLKDNVIQVGGLFETKEDAILFQAAVDVINEDSSINMEPDLVPLVELLPEDDSYEAVRDTCRLLLRGVGAVFGPMSSVSGEHVSDVCNSLNVPHLETRWDPAQEAYDDSLNLFPDPAVLAEAYVALMSHWQWRSVAIVYEEDEEVAEMKGLLEELREADIDADHYARNSTDSFRDVLKRVREDGHTHIFVAIEEEDTEPFLMQAMQIEMLNDEYSYLFRSLCAACWGTVIAGIFGPSSDVTSMHVQSICDALDVPHIEMRWDFQLQRDDLSINLFPKPAVLAKAYVDLIKTWGWNRFALVYEDHEAL